MDITLSKTTSAWPQGEMRSAVVCFWHWIYYPDASVRARVPPVRRMRLLLLENVMTMYQPNVNVSSQNARSSYFRVAKSAKDDRCYALPSTQVPLGQSYTSRRWFCFCQEPDSQYAASASGLKGSWAVAHTASGQEYSRTRPEEGVREQERGRERERGRSSLDEPLSFSQNLVFNLSACKTSKKCICRP